MASKVSAIIFTERADVRNAVRDELRKIGLTTDQLHTPKDEEEVIAQSDSMNEAILVLDWDAGPDIVLNVLDHNRSKGKIDSHCVFMITSKMDANIVAAATEHHVAKIHSGEISSTQIRESLRNVYKEVTNLSPIRQLMKKVGDHKRNGHFQKVHQLLSPIYEKMPNNPRIAVEHGENLLNMGNVEKAEEVLTVVANQDPPYARAKHILAKVFLKKGNHSRAVSCMQGAQLISPYNVKRLLELGNLFLDVNKPQEAKNSFDQVLSIAPKNKGGVIGKSTSMLALGEVNEALSLIKESTNTKELASIFNTSAIISIKKGNHKDAIDLYKTALNAIGKNQKIEARLWFNMGIGFVKWKKPNDSLDCFKKAVDLDSNFLDAQHNISVIEKNLRKTKSKKRTKGAPKKPTQSLPVQGIPSVSVPPLKDPEPQHEFDDELNELEETLGSENLTEEFGELDFDLDFDDDFDD